MSKTLDDLKSLKMLTLADPRCKSWCQLHVHCI